MLTAAKVLSPFFIFAVLLHWPQVRISNRCRDNGPQIYRGHDLHHSGSRDVIGHVTIRIPIPFGPFSIGGPLDTSLLSPSVFEVFGIKHIGVTTLTFLCHVTSSVTWPFESQWAISYLWSIGPKSLSLTDSEILCPKHHVPIGTMLNRHCACAISRDMYPLCKI